MTACPVFYRASQPPYTHHPQVIPAQTTIHAKKMAIHQISACLLDFLMKDTTKPPPAPHISGVGSFDENRGNGAQALARHVNKVFRNDPNKNEHKACSSKGRFSSDSAYRLPDQAHRHLHPLEGDTRQAVLYVNFGQRPR